MTRDEVFAIWPRPWRMDYHHPGCVFDANRAEVLYVIAEKASIPQAESLARMLVEWSQEKP